MMGKRVIMFLMIFSFCAVKAQDFNTHWISSPLRNGYSQIWFRQTYRLKEQPVYAQMTVVSTGMYELHVNQRNITTGTRLPYRAQLDEEAIGITFNVTPFLRPGINTIALWYSPSFPHFNDRQISVIFFGRYKDGSVFSYTSDENWLCKPASIHLLPGNNEYFDGSGDINLWDGEAADPATWQLAVRTNNKHLPVKYYSVGYPSRKTERVVMPDYFDNEGDSVVYHFNNAFRGYVRLTLRGAKRGSKINIQGLEYICNGKLDEQAYRKFTLTTNRRVMVSGDEKFRKDQIQSVQGIIVVPYNHFSYEY